LEQEKLGSDSLATLSLMAKF